MFEITGDNAARRGRMIPAAAASFLSASRRIPERPTLDSFDENRTSTAGEPDRGEFLTIAEGGRGTRVRSPCFAPAASRYLGNGLGVLLKELGFPVVPDSTAENS